jgi:hypothetical protein
MLKREDANDCKIEVAAAGNLSPQSIMSEEFI